MKKDALYRLDTEKTISCPQCGYPIPLHFRWSKLLQCSSCASTIFLEDNGTTSLGETSTLAPEPSLLSLHIPIEIDKELYTPIGKIRYSYGRGFWEEWCLLNSEQRIFWLSVDEGDFALETKAKISLPLPSLHTVSIGKQYGKYIATEKGYGECVGFTGELPHTIALREKHYYVHFSQEDGVLLTAEGKYNHYETYLGRWIDPMHIQKVY
jgi:hypothetical protein